MKIFVINVKGRVKKHDFGVGFKVSVLYSRGMEWDTQLHGKGCSVGSLLADLYEKAGDLKQWGLIRMISGMLKKKVEELDSVRHSFRHPRPVFHSSPITRLCFSPGLL